MFKVGERLVIPFHGVGTIESIEKEKILGKEEEFYVIKFLKENITYKVPTSKIEEFNCRKIATMENAHKVIDILKKHTDIPKTTKTYDTILGKIKTGDIFELAEATRNLLSWKKQNCLTLREKLLLEKGKGLLLQELSISMKVTESRMEEILGEHFLE